VRVKVLKTASICEGVTELDMVALCDSAPVRHFRRGDYILAAAERCESHFLVTEGKVEVRAGGETPQGDAISFSAGQCIGPLMPSNGTRFWIQAAESSAVIELKPGTLACLPEKLQIWIYKNACRPVERFGNNSPNSNGSLEDRYHKLLDYVRFQKRQNTQIVASQFMQEFIKEIPKLPAHMTELSQKLMADSTSIHEIVESIKRDPALAGNILKCVNSAKYSFNKKIETFYHACMILGFNNIYQLVMGESIKKAVAATPETREIQFHSCLISVLCFEVASISKDVHPQTAQTAGLLHDLGKNVAVLLKQKHPAISGFAPLLDTASIGAHLVRHWGLPDRLCRIIESQNEPEFMPPEAIDIVHRKEVAILYFAHLFEGIMTGNPVDSAKQSFNNEHFEALGIPPADVSEIYQSRILPGLTKNKWRIPNEIHHLLPQV
jgi:HD-like signal output (HDOD) protein